MPIFTMQGQIYHHARSLLPLSNVDHKLQHISFVENTDNQIDYR